MWWCRVAEMVRHSEYFGWCSENSPRRIHCKENPLGDCVWGPDGYRTLGCYETYPTEVLHISDDNFVVIADEFSYYGFSPDAPTYDWLPKMARGYRVLESSNVCDLEAGVREPSPVTGDTVLPPRSPIERYDDLPLLGSDADGYFDKHGRRHYFCYSVWPLRILDLDNTEHIASHKNELQGMGLVLDQHERWENESRTIRTKYSGVVWCSGYYPWFHYILIDGKPSDCRNRYVRFDKGQEITITTNSKARWLNYLVFYNSLHVLKAELLSKLQTTKLPKRRRPYVTQGHDVKTWSQKHNRFISNKKGMPFIESASFGLCREMFKKNPQIKPIKNNQKFPELYALLMHVMHVYDPEFEFDSITVNHNVVCKPHIDKYNKKKSYILFLGEFTGGVLYDETGRVYDQHNEFMVFDGQVKHWNDAIQGEKYSVIWYKRYT